MGVAKRQARRDGGTFLEELGRDLTLLGATIFKLADTVARRPNAGAGQTPIQAQQVAFLIAMRHTRSAVFGLDLISPGWSVLLELYRARLEGRIVRITRLVADTGIASTTALRWLDQLCDRGLVERHPDPEGGRGVIVALTGEGARMMDDHFAAAIMAGWALS